MVWHKLYWNWEDGPLDPEEMAGGYDDAECDHDEYDPDDKSMEGFCPTCEEEMN